MFEYLQFIFYWRERKEVLQVTLEKNNYLIGTVRDYNWSFKFKTLTEWDRHIDKIIFFSHSRVTSNDLINV